MSRLKSWLLVLGLSTAVGLFFAAEAHLADPAAVRKGWSGALAVNLFYYWAWGAAVPIVAALNRRFPLMGSGSRLRNFGVHLASGALLTAAEITLVVLVVCPAPTLRIVTAMIATKFYSGFPTYWLILLVLLTLDYYHRHQRRELRAAGLERELAEAQINALRSQLNPHFLFNALNSVSSLMYEDAAAADSMIRKLGELLRRSLGRSGSPEIRLREELEFVQHYLDIEGIRFGERLRVTFDVEPGTMDALVPALILQPVAENAVQHAIAPRKGGHVEISARKDRGWLRLAVTDDGPGIPAGSTEGVGLANTRAQLVRLYGRADALRFESLLDGRTRVELTVPFHLDSGMVVGVHPTTDATGREELS